MAVLDDGVTIADVVRWDGLTAPALFVGSESDVRLLREPLLLAFSSLDKGRPYNAVAKIVRSLGAFLAFYIHLGRPEIAPASFRALVQQYLLYRERGDSDNGLRPLSRNALELELSHLSAYSEFCEREFGYFSLVGQRTSLTWKANGLKGIWKLLACNESDFFSHLALLRVNQKIDVTVPGRKTPSSSGRTSSGMTEQFAWDVIAAEKNETFKAIWLLGFFGGPRLSETLNLWACDVMPGTFRAHWFPGDPFTDLPLVLIANPWTSRWCGSPGDERMTRKEFLAKHFGLAPRPVMAETEGGQLRGKAAGFKGTMSTHKAGAMRQIFWAREEAGAMFADVIVSVLGRRRRMPKSVLHPFLFVNTDVRKPNIQGEMIALSNVRKSFERAVQRVGGTPYRWKHSPHGMRHLYSDLMRELCGRDAAAMQVFMGHRARDSQDAYGTLDLKALQHALASAHKALTHDN